MLLISELLTAYLHRTFHICNLAYISNLNHSCTKSAYRCMVRHFDAY